MLCCTLLCGIWVGTHENCDVKFQEDDFTKQVDGFIL